MPRWPLNKTWFWETAPFFRLLIPLIAGILFYTIARHSFTAYGIILLLSLLGFVVFAFINTASLLINIVRFSSLFIMLFFSAWMLCYFNDVRNNDYWFGNDVTAEHYIVRVNSDPQPKEKTWKLDVSVLYALNNSTAIPVIGNAMIYAYKDSLPITCKQGDTVVIPGKWQPIKNSGNPFEFDYAGYCAKNNIYYRQFLSPEEMHMYAVGNKSGISITEQAHSWCMQQLQRNLPDSAAMGLMQAMLLGDETNLDGHLLQAYADTGIVHIIAISGGNVAIFFLIISFLLSWLKNKKYTWLKYLIALPLVWFYVLMAGAAPSAIRAAIMFSIVAVGFSLQKSSNSLNFLFAAAFILLCAEPMWLFSVGFQLSFIAVLSLVIFYKPIYNWLSPTNSILKGLWSTIAASMAAEILVAPLVIFYFHMFPLLFLIANVLAYLFMGLVLILGMAIVVISFIAPVAHFLGWFTIILVTYFNNIVYNLQQLNPAALHYLSVRNYELVLIYLAIAGIAIFLFRKSKPALFASIGAVCLLLMSFCVNEWHATQQNKLVVYNVSGTTHIELIKGKAYTVLYTDTLFTGNKKKYIVDPAHIAWHAWKQYISISSGLLQINNKTVLLLDSTAPLPGKFQVNYLILTNAKYHEPEQIIKTFNPNTVILPGSFNSTEIERWRRICTAHHILLYPVTINGAFVLE